MVEVTKDMKIGELLEINEMVGPYLMQNGMGCVYCPSSVMETLEEACMVHGMDSDMLTAGLNDILREYESVAGETAEI